MWFFAMWLNVAYLSLLFCPLLDFVQSQNWTHYKVLDGDRKFHLYWKYPANKNGNSTITFKVEVETKGYIGLGFSPNGRMPGSDIVTGWVKDGKAYFQDRHAVANDLPLKDDQQDYELIAAYENDTFTVLEFRRKLDTCDKNDMVIDKSTFRVIYAYSDTDPESDDPFYHREKRGVKSIILLQSKYHENVDLDFNSLLTWDVTSPDIDISSADTLYWCKIFKSPVVREKHHIVYVKPMIQDSHEKFVHHMGIYECVGGTPEEYEGLVDKRGHECWLPTTPVQMLKCQGITVSWGAGGEDLVLPGHVGYPLEPCSYYMFEIHYDNPQLSATTDHSGYKLYYTSNLREFDAGNLMVGAASLPRAFIVPGQEEYIVAGHTGPECIPWADNEVKAIASHPHAHSLAHRITIRHFRGNTELTRLADDKNYDFDYQQFRFYTEEVVIRPGDKVTVECTYNSTSKKNVTLGGPTTRDEMCITFLIFYPRKHRFLTFSAPTFANINKALDINVTNEADVTRVLGSYDWKSVDTKEVENAMRYSEHETYCYYGEFPAENVNTLVAYPTDFKPYETESTCNAVV